MSIEFIKNLEKNIFPRNIRALRVHLNLNKNKFSELTGLSNSRVSEIEKGKNISKNVIYQVVETTGVNANWLLTGHGPMFFEKQGVRVVRGSLIAHEPGPGYGKTDSEVMVDFNQENFFGKVEKETQNNPDARFFKVPKEFFPFENFQGKVYCRKVDGDSMSPLLKSGDFVFFTEETGSIREGEIYVINLGGQILIKRVQKMSDRLRLISSNPDYAVREVSGEELENTKIIGLVMAKFSKV